MTFADCRRLIRIEKCRYSMASMALEVDVNREPPEHCDAKKSDWRRVDSLTQLRGFCFRIALT